MSYEWGVTYAGMLLASEATGDPRFRNYTETRLKFIADAVPFFRRTTEANDDWGTRLPLRNLLAPQALDDCGAMCAAMIKANRGGSKANLLPLIENHINYIMTREFRLKDGTLARNRPQPNTIWLDDLFMSVPAMAQMGKLTGEVKYFDEASKQVLSYAKRMFNKEKGLFFHGWVEAMTEHPEFFWARANGWAFMTQVELLEVLPQDHPSREQLLQLLRAHAKGLASYQSGSGFWHQLLDRHNSYLETSATAIYTYGFARAINRGWIDPLAYGPMTLLAWNAVSTKVNMRGQVEGTCVGTGMAFDPAFYYHRPTSPFAAHGYGPVLLAGAEVINLLKKRKFEINDSSVQTLSHNEAQEAQELPTEWIDADTGHRVIRLSKENGSTSLYFHQNGYTPDGQKLIIMTPTGLSAVNLKTRAVDRVVEGRVNLIMIGKKSGRAYYVKNRIIYSVDLETKATTEIAPLPANGSIASVNADETLLAGAITEPSTAPPAATAPTAPPVPGQARDNYPGKGAMMERRLAERRRMELFTLNIKTGERKTLHKATDWLNHIQFSPTDPSLLMFCHEGPWHKVDRIWTIRTDGSALSKIHTRTMNMEIAGHEFFSGDGKTIWYDLQTPKSQVFWVAGHHTVTGARVQYYVPRVEWSVHFNVSPDGKMFAGDGGGPNSVAAPGDGQWIYLFRPEELPATVVEQLPNAQQMIMPGKFKTERLVNLAKHDYSLEPNVTFTPDIKWVVFRSNMLGPTHVYVVEIEKASSGISTR